MASTKTKQVLEHKIEKFLEPRMVLVRHILVPFDDSEYSYSAYDFALDLAKKYGAKISVLSVMYSSAIGSSFLDVNSHQTSIERNRLKRLSKEFGLLKALADKRKVSFNADVIMSSSVADTILSFASSQKAELIVMGTRGRTGGPRHLRLGSVAFDVTQNSNVPVLLVK